MIFFAAHERVSYPYDITLHGTVIAQNGGSVTVRWDNGTVDDQSALALDECRVDGDMTVSPAQLAGPLVSHVSRAIYTAQGGTLPEMRRHFAIHREQKWDREAAAAVAATLEKLAHNARWSQNDVMFLMALADDVTKTQVDAAG